MTLRDGADSRPSVVVVTGAAGFIGAELVLALCRGGTEVVGLDVRDEGSGDALVAERLEYLRSFRTFHFHRLDLRDALGIENVLRACSKSKLQIVHLAAVAGVRQPDPQATIAGNLEATQSLLRVLRRYRPQRLLFSSSSSVYGTGAALPFHEDQPLGRPASLYAQTKAEGEMLVSTFAREEEVDTTIVRLFNVYGPRMRADLAPSVFARHIVSQTPVRLSGAGRITRDLTYVDDVSRALVQLLDSAGPGLEILNLGTGLSVEIARVLDLLEEYLGRTVPRRMAPRPPTDLPATMAEVSRLRARLGWSPETPVEVGLRTFAEWFSRRRRGRGDPGAGAASLESAG